MRKLLMAEIIDIKQVKRMKVERYLKRTKYLGIYRMVQFYKKCHQHYLESLTEEERKAEALKHLTENKSEQP